jgi:hypothetical protein
MKVIDGFQVHVRYDIPVDDHERVFFPEVPNIVKRSAGTKNPLLMAGLDGNGVSLPGKKGLDLMMQVMGIDHDRPAPGLNQTLDDSVQQRLSVYGKQGLGNAPGMRKQTRAQTRA